VCATVIDLQQTEAFRRGVAGSPAMSSEEGPQ
jgi:hypothetical protein